MNNKTALYIVIVLIVLLGAGFGIYKFRTRQSVNLPQAQITNLVIAHAVDQQGKAVGASTTFDRKKDTIVYVVLTLQDARKNTKISYVRYYNNKYVDSKVTVPAKDGATILYFAFEKGVGMYPAGNYKVVTYVDGRRSLDTTFTFN